MKKLLQGLLVLFLMGNFNHAISQTSSVTGSVYDENNQALPGASILVKGTTTGTVSDIDGRYGLNVPDGNQVLVVSFLGYITQEIDVNGRNSIDVSLVSDMSDLGEVVVVGYGTQAKMNVTGSVESIGGEEIARQPLMQTSQALMGKMAGVTVLQNSSQPGSDAASIRIRGIGTLGNSDPLVLIDGVPGNMNGLDPRDIADMSVLKDAAAAAIYGSRAANGVVLITTKRGTSGELKVNYNGYVGWQALTDNPQYPGGDEYMRLYNLARVNIGQSPAFSEDFINDWQANHLSDPDQYPNTDWIKEIFTENGFQQHHSISLSGGNERIKAMGSLSFMDQNGNINNFNYKRYNARVNTDLILSEKLDFNFDINIRRGIQKQPPAGLSEIARNSFRIAPIYAARFSDGTWGPGWNGQNPVAMVNDGGINQAQQNYARAIIRANYKPIPELKLSFMYSPEYTDDFDKNFTKQYEFYDYGTTDFRLWPGRNQLTQRNGRSLNNNLNLVGTYEKTFGDHFLRALAGYELITYRNDWFNAFRDNFALQNYPELGAGARDNMQNDGSASEWGLQSFFARVNYDFKGRYLFEANIRQDGSSRFAEENRYGTFPAFSAGWRVSEESFFGDIAFITELKLRASWGQLGNQNIGTYPFASTVALGQDFLFGGSPASGAAQLALANRNITWETTETTNVGIDFGMSNNRLTVSAEYYIRNTSGILLQLPIPATIGLNEPYQNAGKVQNRGWDMNLGWRDAINDFSYGINFNISDVHNEVIDLMGAGPIISGNSIRQEGHPIDAIFGYKSAGLFQSQEEIDNAPRQFGVIAPGDIRYVNQLTIDTDGDGISDAADDVINADDRVIIGNPFPRLIYGMNINANFKGFDLSILLQGIGKRDIFLQGDAVWAFQNAGKIQNWHLDYWTPENPNATYPRLVATTSHNNFQTTDYWVFDAAYLRMRNLTVGYTFPAAITDNLSIDRLRLYFSGQNLFTVDNMPQGWDPEIPNGTAGNLYPITAVFTLGVDLTF